MSGQSNRGTGSRGAAGLRGSLSRPAAGSARGRKAGNGGSVRLALVLLLLLFAAASGAARPSGPEAEGGIAGPPLGPGWEARFFLAVHTCEGSGCTDPRTHQTRLLESADGAAWTTVPGAGPFSGSVPDVVARGDTVYLYNPGKVTRYRRSVNRWEAPAQVRVENDQGGKVDFVDPSAVVDEQGRLVIHFLNSTGLLNQDPAGCLTYPCEKHFDSAVEVPGSDGTLFRLQPGHRVSLVLGSGSASDPDIFSDGQAWCLYLSRGQSVQVFRGASLHGSFGLVEGLPDGYLTHQGGVPCGHWDPATGKYWTWAHANEPGRTVVRRFVHDGFARQLGPADFTVAVTGETLGLGAGVSVASPSFALNTLRPGVGDIDGDGVVSADDPATLATSLAGNLPVVTVAAADLDGDGVVTAADVLLLTVRLSLP